MNRVVRNVQLITDNDLCIGCGACRHACPFKEIKIEMNSSKDFYEPVVMNSTTCTTCETQPCLKVCPSCEEDFIPLANWTDAHQTIGPWQAIYTGYSTTLDIRTRASSGGIIKELCRFFLESDRVDAVITLRHTDGLEYEPDLYTSTKDVLNTPGSIYHSINFEQAIEIIRSTPGRFLLVATPCQLTSIRKWQLTCPEMSAGQIEFTIGLICGWMFSRHSLQHFSRATGIEYKDLKDVTYRGGDKIGDLTLTTSDQVHRFSRRPRPLVDKHAVPFRIAFSRTYNNKRCLLCVEHLNYLADVSVGDAWLKAFEDNKTGTSIIIARNPTADSALRALASLGRIELAPATENDVIESQSEDLALGISAQHIVSGLHARGKFAPKYRRPLPKSLVHLKTLDAVHKWYRSYLNPSLFRLFTWKGFGYAWFRTRVLLYPVLWLLSGLAKQVLQRPLGFVARVFRA